MIIPNAEILIAESYDLKGNPEQFTCRWEGPKSGILGVSADLMKGRTNIIQASDPVQVGDTVDIGPYKLRIFACDEEWRYATWYMVRQDNLLAHFRVVGYRFTRWFDLIYRRLIITAAVWKAADYNPAMIPNWQDLYFMQRIISWLEVSRRLVIKVFSIAIR